jgi:hypothetical protein
MHDQKDKGAVVRLGVVLPKQKDKGVVVRLGVVPTATEQQPAPSQNISDK